MRTRFTDTKGHDRDRLDDEYSTSNPRGPSEEKSQDMDRKDSASTNSRGTNASKDYGDVDLNIKVQVQHSVTVDYDPNAYQRENYRQTKGFVTVPR